jgi:Ankyrin repeats (3 copies)
MKPLLVLVAAAAAWSCGIERAPYGGDQELALATATVAIDVSRVTQLLQSGADPNKMVRVASDYQSPWFLALYQLRPGQPAMVEIINAMLKAGASREFAWGTSVRNPALPRESMWRRFMRGGRIVSTGADSAINIAMLHPVPEVIRAITATGFDPRDGQAALVSAVETGETEIVHILVDAGVDVNCHPGANTPLVAAIEARNVALMTFLEEHGAREKP